MNSLSTALGLAIGTAPVLGGTDSKDGTAGSLAQVRAIARYPSPPARGLENLNRIYRTEPEHKHKVCLKENRMRLLAQEWLTSFLIRVLSLTKAQQLQQVKDLHGMQKQRRCQALACANSASNPIPALEDTKCWSGMSTQTPGHLKVISWSGVLDGMTWNQRMISQRKMQKMQSFLELQAPHAGLGSGPRQLLPQDRSSRLLCVIKRNRWNSNKHAKHDPGMGHQARQ